MVVCSELACDTSIQLLELRLVLLVENDVRRVRLLPRHADSKVLDGAHVPAGGPIEDVRRERASESAPKSHPRSDVASDSCFSLWRRPPPQAAKKKSRDSLAIIRNRGGRLANSLDDIRNRGGRPLEPDS